MTQSPEFLPKVLSGERREISDPKIGMVSYYVDGPGSSGESPGRTRPLPILFVHSINASASAHEVKPLFDAYKKNRRVYAIDLPGFGYSERSDRPYRQRLMMDAIHAVINEIRSENQVASVDALALSLACEFLAKAALEAPNTIRSMALVSPTGFAQYAETKGPPEADCGRPGVLRALSFPLLGTTLFRLLTTAPSIRFFLRKTWGSQQIDEAFFETSYRMCRYPGAHRAPFYFISGYLFSADILTVYKKLSQPVWLAHGVRGDFNDFSRADAVADQTNWWITEFDTGALPYFEAAETFNAAYNDFLDNASTESSLKQKPSVILG